MPAKPFDHEARLRLQPIYVESITVFGHRAEPQKITLEQRFADALNATTAGIVELHPVESTGCIALASTRTNIGSSFTPPAG